MQYKKHRFNFFPEIPSEEFDGLKNSISKGFDTNLGKIILFEDCILDGWNRYRACMETGTEPIFETFNGTEEDAFQFSIKANQERRHLTKSQLAAVAIDAEPIWRAIQEKVELERIEKIRISRLKQEEEKRENERKEQQRLLEQIRQENARIEREEALKKQREQQEVLRIKQEAERDRIRLEKEKADVERRKELEAKQEVLRQEEERLFAEQIALQQEQQRINAERLEAESIEKERKKKELEQEQIPQLIAESALKKEYENNESRTKLANVFGTNRQYINDAKKLKEVAPEKFEQVLNGEISLSEASKELKIEARKAEIQKQRNDIENGVLPKLDGFFDIVSVDPPWPYGREYDPENSRVANPYPEMSIEDIKAIDLPMSENSVIFLWTTHKFMPDAFDILKEWGFDYKATLVWNKEKMGMGAWLRMQCEFCLVAIKGKPFWENTTERDIIIESRREHSRKPDAFFEMVNKVCAGRKLEYFSREARDGWEIFGNDTNKF